MQIFSLEILQGYLYSEKKPNVCADWFGNQGNQGKIRPVPPTGWSKNPFDPPKFFYSKLNVEVRGADCVLA